MFLSRRRQARGWGGFSCRGRARVDWGRAQLRSCTNTAVGWRCTRSCGQGCGSPRGGMRGGGTPVHTYAHPRTHSVAQAAEVDAPRPRQPRAPAPGRACRAAARAPSHHRLHEAGGPLAAAPGRAAPRLVQASDRQSHLPAPARAPASTIPFSPRAAAFGCLLDSSRLHALPDFKNKQEPPPPPRGARWASTSPRLPRLGSLLAGPGRDARAVTPRSRRRSLGAPRVSGVRLAIALPPSVSPPVLRCSVRIALL